MSRDRTVLWKRVIFALLSALTMAVIFAFSSQTGEESSFVSGQVGDRIEGIFVGVLPSFMLDYALSFLREGAHVFLYFSLGLFLSLFFFTFSFRCRVTYVVLPSVCALCYACLDEWHQSFVPGRFAAAEDVLLDAVGILLSVGLCCLIFHCIKIKKA